MEKKEQTLLIWILTITGLILAVLYSPIGSPDAYNQQNFQGKQGVNFFGKIVNAPTSISTFQESTNAYSALTKNVEQVGYQINSPIEGSKNIEYKITDPTVQSTLPSYNNRTRKASYAVSPSSGGSSMLSSGASYAVNHSKSVVIQQNSGGGGGIAGGGMAIYSSTSNSGNNNNPVPQSGFTSLNLDLSLFGDSTNTKQGGPYEESQGGTDPGTNPDPVEEPIPVGDGFWLLLLMAAIYAKMRIK